jgi:phage major head subunit gpT-like protein
MGNLSTIGLKSEFFERLDSTVTFWQDLSTRIASTTDQENYAFLGNVPSIREWGTGRLAKGLIGESYNVENLKYEATLEIPRDLIDDDQTGQIRIRVLELAEVAAIHKDQLIGDLLNSGAVAGFNAYDGQPFFSATHESGKSGAQDNTVSTAKAGTNPTIDEFRTSFDQALNQLFSLKDDQGRPRLVRATGLAVVVPPNMMLTAIQALGQTVVASTQQVFQPNPIQGAARIITLPYLTDAAVWYLLKTDTAVRPFIFQDRMPLEFKAVAEGSEEEFMRETYLYGVRARYRMTYGYWQNAIQVTFTGP